ncbi:UrcA family protein [Sphingomonas sanxanigenens]|uniref:UrcA family protein n=1 Tax=Sphingomonas sanxanigenens DSM 19645 = NX02 TaxID=1123269 RepID=W0A873_9SPHN|nr:UrcA family protein [Sphingomonas sanxanigenens]AHE52508.1 hypothetical protein NX02_03770 [Sphingomonas sanxanigenens DSM 19645 = NX02]
MFHTAATIRPIASLTAATGLIALLLAHPPLHAEPAERSAIVHTNDLDLSRPEGRAQLDRRIDITARRLCREESGAPLWRYREVAECRTTAVARAATARASVIQRAGTH